MIISASRRTDIPAFYSRWFFNRLREGYVLVPNPYNPRMVSRVSLKPAWIDCIVFWSKNPAPMIGELDQLGDYKYYFQFTLNPYGREIERKLPSLTERLKIFKTLSDKIGKERVIWRYDPIFVNEKYNISFHKDAFALIAFELKDYTDRCTLEFIDCYSHIRPAIAKFNIHSLEKEVIEDVVSAFQEIASEFAIKLNTCAAKINLGYLGVSGDACISQSLIEQITGYSISASKDKNQRLFCNCIESLDIGMYDSCLNGCVYCYANKECYDKIRRNGEKHDVNSPLLIGSVSDEDIIKDRNVRSFRIEQSSLF